MYDFLDVLVVDAVAALEEYHQLAMLGNAAGVQPHAYSSQAGQIRILP